MVQRALGLVVAISVLLFGILFFPPLSRGLRLGDTKIANFLVSEVAMGESLLREFRAPKIEEGFNLSFKADQLRIDEASEIKMLELINNERKKANLAPLTLDPTITKVAREHSQDMWQRQYFAHDTPDGETPFNRMEKGKVSFRRAGENLALARTVERAHQGLMESEGHRENILDPNFGRVGIGVVDGGVYGKMFTQDFAD